jgi:hypothetical protein
MLLAQCSKLPSNHLTLQAVTVSTRGVPQLYGMYRATWEVLTPVGVSPILRILPASRNCRYFRLAPLQLDHGRHCIFLFRSGILSL